MAKNGIQTIGVMIIAMIMLAFAQADVYPTSSHIEPDNFFGRLKCLGKCAAECIIVAKIKVLYPVCVATCTAKCNEMPIDVALDCISSCDMNNSINIDTDAHGLGVTYLVNSCLQACKKKV
ncbi:uncharacterized protein LOC109803235 [Cajanus cajan]|uniref:uncharacterized protein LOC109803235 n=1 Tax=Cajanus cajan TaxID=3821 RepID=UPI00098DC16E|nr:uncharacterized protein LOC109803235 [Cajanus cajan]